MIKNSTSPFAIAKIANPNKIRVLILGSGRIAHAPLPDLLCINQGAGWREYADGTLIQWGEGQGVNPLVTFPRVFPNLCWHVSVNVSHMAENRLTLRMATGVSTGSFTCSGRDMPLDGSPGGQASGDFTWMAWGN